MASINSVALIFLILFVAGLNLRMISRDDIMNMTNIRVYPGRRFEHPLIVDGMTITKDDTESWLNILMRLRKRFIRIMKRNCM